jgi:hypothetical protein
MINKDFKIIFFNGGFAGDLITALYNPNLFQKFNNNTVLLDDKVLKLKSYEFRKNNSYAEKINYLQSVEHFGVCSSHDIELSIRLKNNTTLVYSSCYKLAKFFYDRLKRIKEDTLMSLDEHIKWQASSKKIFKKQIDLANITKDNFLEELNINNYKSKIILKNWLELNNLMLQSIK